MMIDKKIAIIGLIDDEYIEEATPSRRVLGNRAVILNVLGRVMSFVSTGIGAAVSVAVVVMLVIGAIAGPDIVEFIMEKVITTDSHDDQNTPQTDDVDPENVENGIVTTAAELQWVLNNAVADQNYTVTVKELDMSGLKWNGIENYKGVFDFGGCTVSGARYPMFLSVDGGVVKNLVLANSEYDFPRETAEDARYEISDDRNDERKNIACSPIVCRATNITISNVVIESSVSMNVEVYCYPWFCFGGIIGYAKGDAIIIENCEFKGKLSINASAGYASGIAGKLISTKEPLPANEFGCEFLERYGVLIKNCVNRGEIVSSEISVAGIAGFVSGAGVYRCANYSDILNDGGIIAGIIAKSNVDDHYGLIAECINTGRLYSEEISQNSIKYIGGIVGVSNEKYNLYVNCVNIGEIETSEYEGTGGIVGMSYVGVAMRNCYNLKPSCKIFSIVQVYGAVNPAKGDVPSIKNSANCLSIDQLFEKINAACPGVFVMSDGTIKLADHL